MEINDNLKAILKDLSNCSTCEMDDLGNLSFSCDDGIVEVTYKLGITDLAQAALDVIEEAENKYTMDMGGTR